MPRNLVLILFFFTQIYLIRAQNDSTSHIVIPQVSPALKFTENLGQWDNHILFRAQLDGGALFLEKDALTFNFYDKVKYRSVHHGGFLKNHYSDLDINNHAYKVHFENCNPNPITEKYQMGEDYENFYLGSDQKKWKGNVRNYHQVFLRDLYAGVDYEMLTAVNGIKYNFHVKAGANAAQIKMRYEGVENIKLKNGALLLKLAVNEVLEQKPYAYQLINGRVKQVPCSYKFKNKILSFDFPNGYDTNYDLIIDPILVFAAQSGSLADNFGMTATYDTQGNLYSGGTVFNNGYPVTLGAFSTGFTGSVGPGATDVVITKYNSNGTALLYSTYMGGSQSEIISSMIVDGNNNLCFYGTTGSANFPMTTTSYDNTFNGGVYLSFVYNGTTFNNGTDIFVGKLSGNGNSLLGCTYLGGSDNDGVNHVNHLSILSISPTFTLYEYVTDSLQQNYGDQYRGEIQVDILNNIYITSSTRSSNFPMVNAYDNTLGGKQDAIVAKLNTNLSQLLYSTYLGGTLNECGNSLIINNAFEAYVTGGTCSFNFPTTLGANSMSYNGGKADGFITHLNASGNGIMQSTFIGTTSYDQSYFIQSDKYSNIYVYGQSLGNMPIVNSGTIVPYSNPGRHQFITRYTPNLSAKNLSTVIGSSQGGLDISPSAFAVDRCNNIYLSGWGGNILFGPAMSGMPLFQPTQATTTGFDFYFMGLDSNAAGLKYGSYFGGAQSQEHVDGGTSRFDPGGKIYQSVCAGCGGNSISGAHQDFPVTPGAWPGTPGTPNHNTSNFNCNNGVIKLDFQLQMAVSTINTNTLGGCMPVTVSFTNATPPPGAGATFTWDLGNGNTTSTNMNPSVTYTAAGVYTISLTVEDNLTCNKRDKSITYVTVYPKPVANFTLSGGICSNTINVVNSSTGNFGSNAFAWNFGDGSAVNTQSAPAYTYVTNGTYNVTFTLTDLNGCKDIVTNTLSIFDFSPGAVSSASMCLGSLATLTASGGTSYTWTPAGSLSNSLIANPIANPNVTTSYSVTIVNNSMGYPCTKQLSTFVQVHPKPTASFTLFSSPCSNTVAISNGSTGNFGSNPYSWNFGDGNFSSGSAPAYTYPGNGVFTVSLTVTDVNGCKDYTSTPISIFNFTPGAVSSSSLCFGDVTKISAIGGTGYTWTPGASLDNTVIAAPFANPTITTIYTVNIENTTPGYTCAKTLTTEILVRPTPTANFAFNLNPCGGGANFSDQSQDDVVSWFWKLSPTKTSTVQNPYFFYKNGGTFTVNLFITNRFGCVHQVQKVLQVDEPPQVSVGSTTAICKGDKAQLSAEGGVSYQWSPGQTLDFPNMSNPIASPIINTEYSVVITTTYVVNNTPCSFLLNTEVFVDVLSTLPVSANANPVVVVSGNTSTLSYIGDPGALVRWHPIGSTIPEFGYTVYAKPDRPTTYTAVANRGACKEDVVVHVDAYSDGCDLGDLFIPNTFTPNGDGQNDVLYVRGIKVEEVYFAIYNRWGELIFESKDKNKGWDGTYKGKAADAGVFGWYVKIKCFVGGETFKKGNVTLVR